MSSPSARVLLDSVSPDGERLLTVEATFHRFVLAEFNTHRFSRNSASSRAIPVKKMLDKVRTDPAYPIEFPIEQKGMQGGELLDKLAYHKAVARWDAARLDAISHTMVLAELGLHKSLCNRLLEPFLWHTVIASSTAEQWRNFFKQRCSPLAMPEIRAVAEKIEDVFWKSAPKRIEYGDWHTPLILKDEYDQLDMPTRCKVSVARCARISYLTHEGKRDIEEDLKLYVRLVSADPPHWSPLEHVATPCIGHFYGVEAIAAACGDEPQPPSHQGNFVGWDQLRHSLDRLPESTSLPRTF